MFPRMSSTIQTFLGTCCKLGFQQASKEEYELQVQGESRGTQDVGTV